MEITSGLLLGGSEDAESVTYLQAKLLAFAGFFVGREDKGKALRSFQISAQCVFVE